MAKKLINEKRLNLACGQSKVEGYFGIDIVKTDTADFALDLECFPWDIETGSANEIICSHYVEHTPEETYSKRILKAIKEAKNFDHFKMLADSIDVNAPSDGLILFMDEVYRILTDSYTDEKGDTHGGIIKVIAPYYSSMRCWQDPTHRRAISEVTFMYFNKQWREINRLDHYGIKADFDFVYGYDMDSQIASRNQEFRDFAIKHYINVINDIQVTLTKRVTPDSIKK